MGENHLKTDSDLTRFESLVCGAVAGLTTRFVIAPLDLVKIRMQLSHRTGQHHRPSSLIGTVGNIWRNEGFRAFWKGNSPAEGLYVLYSAVQFSTLRLANRTLAELGVQNEQIRQLLAGGVAGSTATLASYPLDFLRTRTAANMHKKSTLWLTITDTWRREGIPGFYHGSLATLFSVFPYMALFFGTYSYMREKLVLHENLPPVLTASSIASVFSKAAVYPLDTIRKRVQVHGMRTKRLENTAGFGHTYSHNVIMAGRQIVANEGALGLYRGLAISLLKSWPGSTISMVVFEATLNIMRLGAQPQMQ